LLADNLKSNHNYPFSIFHFQLKSRPTPTLPKGGSLITSFYLATNEALGNRHAARRCGIQKTALTPSYAIYIQQ
jgi:hypothetical protein